MPDLLLAPRLFRASKDDYVRPLHRRASLAIACACLVLGYIWLFVAWTAALRAHPMPGIADVAAPTALLLAAGLSLSALLANRDVTSDVILCGGVILVQYLWPHPLHYLLAPVIACLAGLLLSRSAAFLAALSLSFLPGLPTESLLALWIGATSFWVASDWIYAALRQVAERQEAALRLEKELLRRRQELRSLNDSLRNAYTLLERTNHELAEARDEAEEARRLKTQFAATISHELRTPLNLILGFSEVMYKTPESYVGAVLTPDLCGDIREIYRATAHLLDLVDDVLDLSRVEQVRLALVPEKTDMLALIHEAAQTVAGLFRGKVQLQLELPPSLPPCTVDRTRIRQVLINLLTNAARFTEQGEVRVSASFDEAHGEITICVSDTGPGIPAEERARLFDAFYQVASPLRRSQGGTGLGLAICKTFVQLHGGRIWVASEVGKGSHFYFSIPVRGQVQRAAAEWKLPGAPDP
ncbi:MAG: sensor histidine kinase, partial [Anaerolineae bacterium]